MDLTKPHSWEQHPESVWALVCFLYARLEEDENVALRATPGVWVSRNLGRHDQSAVLRASGQLIMQTEGPYGAADALHMVRFNPDRVLADIRSKYRILNTFRPYHAEDTGYAELTEVLRHMTLPYRDHRDFDPEWIA